MVGLLGVQQVENFVRRDEVVLDQCYDIVDFIILALLLGNVMLAATMSMHFRL